MKKALLLITAAILAALVARIYPRLDAISSNPNPLIRHFSPTWRSAKKIMDIPYLASTLFAKSALPVYEIKLSKNDLFNLLTHLPNYPQENRLYDDLKYNVKAEFRQGAYHTSEAKIRYRGNSPNHWNALKKSWQVDLPASEPLNGRTSLRFFIGEDKGWVKAMFWNHLGKKLDVARLDAKPVRLVVNRRDMGVYILIEGWEKFDSDVFTVKNIPKAGDRLRPEALGDWYNRKNPQENIQSYPILPRLITLAAEADNEKFGREIGAVLDADAFLRWTVMAVLAGDFNQSNFDNLNFYLNEQTGKLEPVFFDEHFAPISDTVDVTKHRIASRLLQNAFYRKRFEQLLRSYVIDNNNLTDDLAFYDAVAKQIIPDIYRDTAKIQTSAEARVQIQNDRDIYEHNFSTLRSMFVSTGHLTFVPSKETYPLQ